MSGFGGSGGFPVPAGGVTLGPAISGATTPQTTNAPLTPIADAVVTSTAGPKTLTSVALAAGTYVVTGWLFENAGFVGPALFITAAANSNVNISPTQGIGSGTAVNTLPLIVTATIVLASPATVFLCATLTNGGSGQNMQGMMLATKIL